MQRRFLPFALLAALASAACADETPTLSGEEQFPPGSIAVTREVIVPASRFFRTLGTFSGYSSAADAPYQVAANQYGGALNANVLVMLRGFPSSVTFNRGGTSRTDSAFSYTTSRLVLGVDSAAAAGAPFTVTAYEVAQRWDPGSATWTHAVDTAGGRVAWAQPGGTLGAELGSATYPAAGADSLVITLSGAVVRRLSDTLSQGIALRVTTPGARVEFSDVLLRAAVRPDSAQPDTTIFVPIRGQSRTVYTPEQPDAPAGIVAVGGIRSARTLLELDLDQTVPGCAVGQSCAEVPLTQVQLNQVAVLLRPAPVPLGFEALGPVPLALRLVDEPELGRVAPLGQTLLDRGTFFNRGDTLVVLPVTNLASTLAANDSLPRTFALVSEFTALDVTPGQSLPPTFGVAFFHPDARLRIVYTLPARRPLP